MSAGTCYIINDANRDGRKYVDLLCVGDGIYFIYNHWLKQHSVKTKHCPRHKDYGASMEITQFANSKVSMLLLPI